MGVWIHRWAALAVAVMLLVPAAARAEDEATDEEPAVVVAQDEQKIPKGYESWDPEVAAWGWKGPIEGIVWGSIGFGLLVAGDQINREVAEEQGFTRTPVMSSLTTVDHIPRGTFADIPVEWGVRSYVGEYMFTVGLQAIVPSLGTMIPSAIAGASGVDLQTAKAVGCFSMALSFIPTGVTHLARWAGLYVPQWQLHQQDEQGIAYVIPGVISMALTFVNFGMGGVALVWGLLYATEWEMAGPEPGLFPMPSGDEIPDSPPIPMITTDGNGGVLFGWQGVF